MNIDTAYVFNPSTRRYVRASGRIGRKIADKPNSGLLIDTDQQCVHVWTPDHSIRVKTVRNARFIVAAYVTGAAWYQEMIRKFNLD